jgi:hypothetical protein
MSFLSVSNYFPRWNVHCNVFRAFKNSHRVFNLASSSRGLYIELSSGRNYKSKLQSAPVTADNLEIPQRTTQFRPKLFLLQEKMLLIIVTRY